MLPSLSVRSFWTLMNAMCPPREVCRRFCKEYHTGDLGVLAQNILTHNGLVPPEQGRRSFQNACIAKNTAPHSAALRAARPLSRPGCMRTESLRRNRLSQESEYAEKRPVLAGKTKAKDQTPGDEAWPFAFGRMVEADKGSESATTCRMRVRGLKGIRTRSGTCRTRHDQWSSGLPAGCSSRQRSCCRCQTQGLRRPAR